MKRIGFLFERIADIDNIKLAIRNSSKGKRRYSYVKRVLKNPGKYAERLREMLLTDNIRFGNNRHITIQDESSGKERDITVPQYFPDQVLQWAVMQQLQKVIMRGMYKYCCGSVPGRGGMAAKRAVDKILKNDTKVRYILKMDVRKFFPSVNHEKLIEMLERKIKDRRVINLLRQIIEHGESGLPIGYYTSQWLSNFYLEPFDHFVTEELRARHYIRYVDDIVIFETNKRKLRKIKERITDYLSELSLTVKDNWQIWKIDSRPLDFVGYLFRRRYTLARRKIFHRLMRTVRKVEREGLKITSARRLCSLLGWFSHINFRQYYAKHIAPIITKKAIRKYISRFDKKAAKAA